MNELIKNYKLYEKYTSTDGINYLPSGKYVAIDNKNYNLECNPNITFNATYDFSDSIAVYENLLPQSYLNNWAYVDKNNNLQAFDSNNSNDRVIITVNEVNSPLDIFFSFKDNLTNLNQMFSNNFLISLDLSSLNTNNATNMEYMFRNCLRLSSLNLSNFDTSKVVNIRGLFWGCSKLTNVDLSNFDLSHITDTYVFGYLFYGCNSLTYIKCKQAFKNWCWTNQDEIRLPTAMCEGGSGTWEIIN